MPVPLLWLGAGIAGIVAGGALADKAKKNSRVDTYPGETRIAVKPTDGAVVCCGIYGVFEHTGIWLDGQIIELHGTGLVKAVSPERFLANRSGSQIYIACNTNRQPLVSPGCGERAVNKVFHFIEYDAIHNNCHRFTLGNVIGEEAKCVGFYELNQKLSDHFSQSINWMRTTYC